MKFSALTLSLWAATASAATIGSYESTNDVTVLTSMGTDLDAIGDALKAADDVTAKNLYENGSASTKTFKSLSVDGNAQQVFIDYYGSNTYADDYIQAAFSGGTIGSSDFGAIDAVGKEQIIKKAAAYMNAYGSVLEHANGALSNCGTDSAAAVKFWDEAAALYYGTGGEMVYAMGEKRCENFGTCVNGEAAVNTAIFGQLNAGKAALESGDCDAATAAAVAITEHMQIPLVQGVIRAAYKLDKEDGAQKELGYGTVFAASVLPMVAKCSADDAKTISDNLAPTTTGTDFAAVKTAFENNYECMGITCEQVAGLVSKEGGFEAGAEPCGAAAPAPTADAPAADAPAADAPAADAPAADTGMAADDSSASVVGVVGSAFAAVATAMLF